MNRLSSLASSDSGTESPLMKLHDEELHIGSTGGSNLHLASLLKPTLRPTLNRPRAFFLPVRYEPGYQYPLVVWLHNDGYNEHQIGQVMPHISTRNYIGVGIRGSLAIDSTGRRFAWAHTPAAVARCEDAVWQAVDDACRRYSIHRDRIFLAGYGEGGTMARRVAFQRSSQFAGCIALGGRLPRGGAVLSNLAEAQKLKNLWAIAMRSHSLTEDQFDDDIRLAADARLRLDVRRYTIDDEMVTEVLSDVNAWIMRIVTGQTVAEPVTEDWNTSQVPFSTN